MEKEGALLVILFIISLNLASASYVCSDQGQMSEEIAGIDIGKTKSINGIRLGVGNAEYVSVFGRIEAEVFIDAQAITLTDTEPSISITFTDEEDYNVTLLNYTADNVNIKIDGSSKIIEVGEETIITNLDVLVISSEGSYPGPTNIELIIGIDKISLSNQDNPAEIVDVDDREFLVEISDATDAKALFNVKKCENISATIEEIEDAPENNTEPDNDTIPDDINDIIDNDTDVNDTSQDDNETLGNQSGNNQTNGEDNENQEETAGFLSKLSFYSLIVLGAILLIVIFRYLRNKPLKDKINEENQIKNLDHSEEEPI